MSLTFFRFGRVPALVIANILGALGGALSAVSSDIYVFCVFRFITGMAFDNCFTMMYILGMATYDLLQFILHRPQLMWRIF